MADKPTCLCIVSGERLRGADFVAALRASLRPHDQLEIIIDRRSGEPLGEWERQEERRQRPQVDAALRANGFAVIPAPSSGSRPDHAAFRDDLAGAGDLASGGDLGSGRDFASGGSVMSGREEPVGFRDERAGFRDEGGGFRDERRGFGDERRRLRGDRAGLREDRNRLSLLVPSASESDATFDDEDEERLAAIREFKRERSTSLVRWLVVALIVVAPIAFVLSRWGQTMKNDVAQRVSPDTSSPPKRPAQNAETPTTQGPVVTDKPGAAAPRGPASEPAPADRPARAPAGPGSPATENTPSSEQAETAPRDTNVAAPRDAGGGSRDTAGGSTRDTTAGSARDSSGSRDSGAASRRDSNASAPREPAAAVPRDTTAPRDGGPSTGERPTPRDTADTSTRGRPRAGESARTTPAPAPRETAAAPPTEPVMRGSGPRFAGLPRVELVREGSASGGAYAVKIADPSGRMLSDADVLLIARMADGTLENVRMGFVPEQGAYRGALPPARSTPVDLRIRVITGDKRIEVPIAP